ncbi:MAG TPA: lysine--tRNA ligase, partial [Pyrinomonadaceae bacterium]
LDKIQALTGNAYPNKFRRTNLTGSAEGEDTITSVVARFKQHEPPRAEGARPTPEQLEAANTALKDFGDVRVSGRISVPPRVMGKAAFVHLSDGRERLQIYVRRDDVQAMSHAGRTLDGWELFSLLDHGDFIGVEGFLFVTKTGELSVHVRAFEFLSKALLPMPDKMHGISDPEIRQRQRYADLIAGSLKIERDDAQPAGSEQRELTTREVFERRSKIIREMRAFLDARGYIEVETPMLTPIASGAAARPFKTHHNALDIDLYARIAPELYLKRLLVGGFERVYELNRNFRNEGISTRHNPEFTMLEFYCAYMDVNGMMDFCEEMLRQSLIAATGGTVVPFGDQEFDFGRPFERVSMRSMVNRFAPDAELTDENLVEMFETHAEPHLLQPTFIVDFPKAVSPLSKASPDDPSVAERFELFINGMECANGFSELNDPLEQYERFKEQGRARERGDEEAMQMDTDYVRALAYGMPPAAGIGIGIDRIVMLLTNRRSIRDVILFPHMRPAAPKPEETAEQQ